MSRQAVVVIVVIVVLLLAGMWLLTNKPVNAPTSTKPLPTSGSEGGTAPTSQTSGQTKEFTVTGSNYSFDPATLTVNKGDTVKVTFKNSGGNHDFVLPDFNVQTKVINTGESETVTFTASKAGTFEYFCSVGNHRAMGMKGSLVVK